MLSLEILTKQLDQAVQNVGGIDNALEACDRMYSATFRSEAFPLDQLEYWEEEIDPLLYELSKILYKLKTGIDLDKLACLYEFECHSESALDLVQGVEIEGHTKIVKLCNYKGEMKGFALLATCKKLPIFKSKNESFYQVN